MPHFVHCAVLEQHFDNVKPDLHFWVFQEPKVIERRACKPLAPLFVDRGSRPSPLLRRPGFDFHEHQAVVVTKNEIDFASRRAKVCRQKLESQAAELFFGGRLAQGAATQVDRKRCSSQQRPQAEENIHEIELDDCFDFDWWRRTVL